MATRRRCSGWPRSSRPRARGSRARRPWPRHSPRRIADDETCPTFADARPAHRRPDAARGRTRAEEPPPLHADPRLRADRRVRAALHGAGEGLVSRRGPRREDRARPGLGRHRQAHRGRPGRGRHLRHLGADRGARKHRRQGEGHRALVPAAAARHLRARRLADQDAQGPRGQEAGHLAGQQPPDPLAGVRAALGTQAELGDVGHHGRGLDATLADQGRHRRRPLLRRSRGAHPQDRPAAERRHPRAHGVGRPRPRPLVDLAGGARGDDRERPRRSQGVPARHAERRGLRVPAEALRRGRRLRPQASSRGGSRRRAGRRAGGRALRLRRGGDGRQDRRRPVRGGPAREDARHVHAVPRAQAQGAARGDLHERPAAGEEVMALVIRGARVLAGSPPVLRRADVLVEADRIAAVGPGLAGPAGARELDASGRIVLPGLGNAHTHAASHLARGRAGNWTLEDLLTHAPANYGHRTPEDDYLDGCARLVRDYGVGVHTHLAESKVQVIESQRRFGKSIVTRLAEHRLLGPGFVGAHGVWLADDDIRMLAAAGAAVAHNPGSNLRLGCGIAPVRELLDRGVTVGLGTDGSVCADNQNLFEALRIASVVSTIRFPHETGRWLDAGTVWNLATAGSARVLGQAADLGAVAAGRKADLVLVRADSVFLQPLADPLNALVYSETGAGVETVLVDGRVVLEGGRVTTVDEASIYARAQEAAERQHRASAESRALAGRLAPFVAAACRAAVATPLPFDRYAAPART